jgi:hypothetical protein
MGEPGCLRDLQTAFATPIILANLPPYPAARPAVAPDNLFADRQAAQFVSEWGDPLRERIWHETPKWCVGILFCRESVLYNPWVVARRVLG